MQLCHRLIALILIATATTAAQAATPATTPAVPLADCVDLGPQHEAFRFGSQYLLVQDGDNHYRLSFSGGCDAILHSSSPEIVADGKSNRLCARGTKVSTGTYSCAVSGIDQIGADTYTRYRRRSR